MGYTHYLRRKPELPRAEFRSAVADCKVLLARLQAAGLRLAWEDDQPDKPPRLTLAGIRFNGTGPAEEDLGHETFLVDRVHRPYRDHTGKVYQTPDKNGRYFTFCKTARKPYDLAVCGCLVALSHHLDAAVEVGSDGDDDEENWPKARELCQELFGYGWDFSVESLPERLTPKGLLRVEDVTDRQTGKPVRWGFHSDVGMKELANGWVLVTRYAPDRLAWRSRAYGRSDDIGANDPTARYGGSLYKVSLYPGQWDAKDGRGALGHYDSLPEAVREATKLDVWATCYRLPGADLFLPGVLNDKNGFPGPHALNLLVWADWCAERAVVREYALAERHLRALAPLPARRRRAEPEPEALACH